MVVLESSCGMLPTSGNQYLQPEYLSPLSTTLDAKKSPLALLAQTCSQIGADSPPNKSLLLAIDKPKKSDTTRSSPSTASRKDNEKSVQRSTPTADRKLVFKPYESSITPKKFDDLRPKSENTSSDDEKKSECHQSRTPDDRKTISPSTSTSEAGYDLAAKSSPSSNNNNNEQSGTGSPNTAASPIIASGLDILQSTKDHLSSYKPGTLLSGLGSGLSGLSFQSQLESSNPAFRPPFSGAAYSHPMSGYPGSAPNMYFSYARVKTPSGGEALVPVCKDPYCTGCQFSLHNQQLLMSGAGASPTGPCPSGCTQCDHQKYNFAMAMSAAMVPSAATSLAYSQLSKPYVCSWIAGDNYCGKRFITSEDLLQHLRTHTSGSDSASIAAAAATSSAASSFLSHPHLFSRPGGYHHPSSLSVPRFHPYGKPTLTTTLAASPYSAFNPTTLGPYYSPYSMYSQRLGAAAVHP